jgi:hypothetical protein
MKVVALGFIVASVYTMNSYSNERIEGERKGYRDSVQYVLSNIKKTNDRRAIAYCVPLTQKEAETFFSFDYDHKFSSAFHELQGILVNYSVDGDETILKPYLCFSEFVDGYFAEDYFISIEKIANSKASNFCTVLQSCNKERVKRLVEVKSRHCH